DRLAALAVLLELPRRLEERAGLGEGDARAGAGKRLAVITIEKRLRVKRVDRARAALHEQEDDALGLRLEVRLRRADRDLVQKRVKREGPEPEGRVLEQVSAGEGEIKHKQYPRAVRALDR